MSPQYKDDRISKILEKALDGGIADIPTDEIDTAFEPAQVLSGNDSTSTEDWDVQEYTPKERRSISTPDEEDVDVELPETAPTTEPAGTDTNTPTVNDPEQTPTGTPTEAPIATTEQTPHTPMGEEVEQLDSAGTPHMEEGVSPQPPAFSLSGDQLASLVSGMEPPTDVPTPQPSEPTPIDTPVNAPQNAPQQAPTTPPPPQTPGQAPTPAPTFTPEEKPTPQQGLLSKLTGFLPGKKNKSEDGNEGDSETNPLVKLGFAVTGLIITIILCIATPHFLNNQDTAPLPQGDEPVATEEDSGVPQAEPDPATPDTPAADGPLTPDDIQAQCPAGGQPIDGAFDGNEATAWVCPRANGIDGTTVTFRFTRPVIITGASIMPGWSYVEPSGASKWESYRVVSGVKWTLGQGQRFRQDINPVPTLSEVSFPNVATQEVTLTIQQTEEPDGAKLQQDAFAIQFITLTGHPA